ncbi:unnamed protein product [Sphenostylis stenocarpa]|uniref:Uncharacterized protein n=1 Tax=Sphenostylis stenocarpa TaxID=92480 RepID=A0AA86SPA9_9FABA|nr:unnamed protein product [Sphenostylis stenocarpa]
MAWNAWWCRVRETMVLADYEGSNWDDIELDKHGPSPADPNPPTQGLAKARVMHSFLALNGTVTTRDGKYQTHSRKARSVKPSHTHLLSTPYSLSLTSPTTP